ncbi:MAG TPA: hypothetical protein VFT71_01370 [Candidatus Nitrosocosmicus sp.]|nr:hypothetical protein [Candidatus Nitrosocosmicus sp.]
MKNGIDDLILDYCNNLSSIGDGLEPDVLAYWYKRIEDRSKEICSKELGENIVFKQDRILWMKFEIKISKRAVHLVLDTIRQYIPLMPYSTSLYFEKVYQLILDEYNRDLI